MKASCYVEVRNKTKGTVLGEHIEVANTGLRRLVGLLGRRGLDRGSGLHILPSSGVHTFGMLFPIDIVALDRKRRVRGVWISVRAWRLAGVHWKTHSVLELPAGAIRASGTDVDDELILQPSPGNAT